MQIAKLENCKSELGWSVFGLSHVDSKRMVCFLGGKSAEKSYQHKRS